MSTPESGFPIGSQVQLKTGGPKLSVRSVGEDEITVEWFEGEKLRKHSFLPVQLQLVPEREMSDLEVARRAAFVLDQAARSVPGFEKIDSNSLPALINHVLSSPDGTNE
jgi:uncharacterized protein YodC (DUF2158 family)